MQPTLTPTAPGAPRAGEERWLQADPMTLKPEAEVRWVTKRACNGWLGVVVRTEQRSKMARVYLHTDTTGRFIGIMVWATITELEVRA